MGDGLSASRTESRYLYDKNNRVVQIDHPGDLATEYFGYDEVGNLLWKQYGTEPAMLYRYDDLNRLTSIWYSFTDTLALPITYPTADPDVAYTYVGGSRLRSTVTNLYDGMHTYLSSYEYDLQDRLVTYTPPAPSGHGDITYTYNALGQKAGITNGSLAVHYDYYANGWLKRVRRGTNLVSAYTYDVVGNRSSIALGNGASTAYAYDTDPRYRVSAITHTPTVGDPVTISYTSRDSAGNPLSMQDWNGTTAYTYDNNSRLVQTGGYDWVGNRNPTTWSYNADDQLTATPSNQYTYLMTGSLLEQYNGAGTVLQKEYAYTYTNLLESVTHDDVQGVPTSTMTWDADGNRIAFTSSQGGTTQFVYDPTAGIPAVIEEVLPGPSSVYYVREPYGALIARIDGSSTSYYHFDALGSTKLLTDGSGAVTDKYTYDAWGALTNHEQLTGSITQPYEYVGESGYYTHYQDANLPLLQLGVRFYDPALGRFTQHGSPYTYADNAPTSDDPEMEPLGKGKRKPVDDEPPGKPKCAKGSTPVWITCYDLPNTNTCAYGGHPREPSPGNPGTCATFCSGTGKPTFPRGTIIDVPHYGKCKIQDCGPYKSSGYRDWPWVDTWQKKCPKNFATGWRCVKVVPD